MRHAKVIFVLLCLAGCSGIAKVEKATTESQTTYAAVRKKVEDVRQIPTKEEDRSVTYHTEPLVTLTPTRTKLDHADRDTWCRFHKLATSEPVTLLEFAQLVTRWCHIPVRISPDAISLIDGPNLQGGTNAAMAQGMQAAPTATAFTSGFQGAQGAGMQGAYAMQGGINNKMVDITYRGDVEGLFDVVTARFGLSWKKEPDHSINIYNFDSDTFYLYSIALENTITADTTAGTTTTNGVSGGSSGIAGTASTGSGVGGTTGSMQSAKVSIKTAIWSDIQKTLNVIKSPRGACNVSPSTGSITCTDTGNDLRKIRKYVTTENKNLTKQVLFNVRVLSVSMKDNTSLGLSWNAIWQSMSSKYGIQLVNTFAGAQGGMTGTFSVLQSANSAWAGTDAVLNALSEFGTVSIIKEPSVATMNLQAVPIQVGNVDSYVPGSTTVTTPNVGTQTSLQIGTITTGFSMTLLPYVMPDMDNQMLLHFSLSLSSLDDVRKIQLGNAYAEAPMIRVPINSVQQIRLRPGQTLMLTGFDQEDSTASRQGTSSPENWLFGGGVKGTKTRSTLAVLITPVILD